MSDRSHTSTRGRPQIMLGLLLIFAILMLSISACGNGLGIVSAVRGSGDLVTQDYDYDDFTGLDVSSAFVVTVTQSDAYSVNVTADDNVFGLVTVDTIEGTLVIGLDSTTRLTNVTLRATITMPALGALKISGATKATVSGFSSKDALALEASGASSMTGDVTAGVVGFKVSGASKIELEGTATELTADVSGASHLLLSDFMVTHADVNVSGASECRVNLSGRLDADVSGASRLRYLGEPTMGDVSTSGASSIERR